MTDNSEGPGWWQASDGKWYPPDQAPAEGTAETKAGAGTAKAQWWASWWLVVPLLFLCTPLGVVLVLVSNRSTKVKVWVTAVAAVLFGLSAVAVATADPKEDTAAVTEQTTTTQRATTTTAKRTTTTGKPTTTTTAKPTTTTTAKPTTTTAPKPTTTAKPKVTVEYVRQFLYGGAACPDDPGCPVVQSVEEAGSFLKIQTNMYRDSDAAVPGLAICNAVASSVWPKFVQVLGTDGGVIASGSRGNVPLCTVKM